MLFFYVITVVIAILALLLTLVVLLQSGQGGGLAGIASGGAARQVLGTRQAPDLLERATWTLGAAFIVLCLLTNFTVSRGGGGAPQPVTQPGQTQMPPGSNSQGSEPGGNSQGVQQPEAPAQQQENPPAEPAPDGGAEEQ